MKNLVRRVFYQTLARAKAPDALKDSMRNHERSKFFIENLTDEMFKIQKIRASKGRQPHKIKHLEEVIRDMTLQYLYLVKTTAEHEYKSSIEKLRIKQMADDQFAIEQTADGKPTGDFESMVKDGELQIGETVG